MSNDHQGAPQSYDQIEIKEFKSSIPPHLLGKLSDSDRWLVETMSRLQNQNNWLVTTAVTIKRNVLDCDRRISDVRRDVSMLSDWKQLMTGKWGVIAVIAVIVVPVVLKFVLDLLWHLWKI